MYPSSGTTIRQDVQAAVIESAMNDRLFIGLQVFPPMPVETKTGQYPKVQIAPGELISPLATPRTSTGSYGEVTRNWTTDTYDCVDYGLESFVGDTDVRDLARFFDLEVAEANWTRRNVQLAHEQRVAAALFNTTNFGAATNSVVAYTAANLATIDFPQDVLNAIKRVKDKGELANTIVLNETVFTRLALSTKLQQWIRGTLKGGLDAPINAVNVAAAFADFGIERVLVGGARINTGKKGQAATISEVWSNTYVWVGYVNPAATIPQEVGAGATLYWAADGGIFTVETYRNEQRRANVIRVRQNVAEKVINGNAGTLINTQYA